MIRFVLRLIVADRNLDGLRIVEKFNWTCSALVFPLAWVRR